MTKKKAAAWILTAMMTLSLAACSSNTAPEVSASSEAQEPVAVTEDRVDGSEESPAEEDESDTDDEQEEQDNHSEPAGEENAAAEISDSQSPQLTETASVTEQQAATAGSSTLIVYFSRHGSSIGDTDADAVSSASLSPGNVILVASMVEQLTGADTFQIVTVDPYPKDYRETTNVASVEKDNSARPALSTHVENMDAYDTIILGYPNWWGTIPMPVAAFLEEYDLSGKTIVPYCVHEGSGLGSSVGDITTLAPGATVLSGLSVSTGSVSSSNQAVEDWLADHGLL